MKEIQYLLRVGKKLLNHIPNPCSPIAQNNGFVIVSISAAYGAGKQMLFEFRRGANVALVFFFQDLMLFLAFLVWPIMYIAGDKHFSQLVLTPSGDFLVLESCIQGGVVGLYVQNAVPVVRESQLAAVEGGKRFLRFFSVVSENDAPT